MSPFDWFLLFFGVFLVCVVVFLIWAAGGEMDLYREDDEL